MDINELHAVQLFDAVFILTIFSLCKEMKETKNLRKVPTNRRVSLQEECHLVQIIKCRISTVVYYVKYFLWGIAIMPPEGRHHRLLRTRQINFIVIDLCMWHAMITFIHCLRPAPIASTRPIPERRRLGQQTLRCSPLQGPSVREFEGELQPLLDP